MNERTFELVAHDAHVAGANRVLQEWNRLDDDAAAFAVFPCCGSSQWAARLAAERPFHQPEEMLEASDRVWLQLDEKDWEQAFATHPRIGEKTAPVSATERSSAWSGQEQSQVAQADAEILDSLRNGNASYEAKFGRTYIVCATGKSAEEMLAILQRRLNHDPMRELMEAAEQQRQITQIRLKKWLSL